MSRALKIALGILVVAVVVGVINFQSLRGHILRLARSQKTEEQARREVLAPPVSTPTDKLVQARIYWAGPTGSVAPFAVQLPLSDDPVERAKQVLQELITSPPTPDQRTLPADTELLNLYILPDGTAIADFSDAIVSNMPSGILSEQLAIDSIARTLENNVPSLHRLKILIHGQEVDTLAGHIDLTGFFDLNPPVPSQSSPAESGAFAAPLGAAPASPAPPSATAPSAAPQSKPASTPQEKSLP